MFNHKDKPSSVQKQAVPSFSKLWLSLFLSAGLVLNSCLPGVAQSATPLNVTANFDRVITKTKRENFGIDTLSMYDPTVVASTSPLRQSLAQMKVGMWRMMCSNAAFYSTTGPVPFSYGNDSWVTANQQWNTTKIQAAVKELPKDFPVILCIPNWPSWMNSASGDGSLDPSQYGAFATWCGSLAQIVKKARSADHKIYFEIFNEASQISNYNSNQAVLAQIYNQCAVAIKAVDPNAVIGGPAIPGGMGSQLVFVQNAAPNLDFFTAHYYPVGKSLADSNNQIYQYVRAEAAPFIKQLISDLQKGSPTKNIPLIVDEYNINWNWRTGLAEPRQQTNVGAVADAIFNISAINYGAYATAAFADYDNEYFGHIQNNYALCPNGNALLLLNEFFVGDITTSTSPDLTQLVTLACKSDKGKCLLIANENPTATAVSLSCGHAIRPDKIYTAYIIDANGFRQATFTGSALLSQINLTNDSVTVLVLDK